MATLLAPYNTAMQLGSGFNSFTQQLCIDHAVIRDPEVQQTVQEPENDAQVAQEVTFKSAMVDKVTDVTSAMNINAAFAIKYDAFDAKGKGDFINTSKVKESDVSFMVSVKVVNQRVYDHSLTKFQPIAGLKGQNFPDVYGDCFISGWQEGGEFLAVISIKVKDRDQAEKIKADASIQFTNDKLDLNLNGEFGRNTADLLNENETTISVTWTGGGQDLKDPEKEWTLETMKEAALRFPKLVSETPMRTHAILTKYTALRSFYAANLQASIPQFEKAGVYATLLQEAYLDYKTIAKNLQVLAFDVSAGTKYLKTQAAAETRPAIADTGDQDSLHSGSGEVIENDTNTSLSITKPYPPTLEGLETARQTVRYMLNRIVDEVDLIAKDPELARDEKRPLPYMSPFLFKELLPVGEPVIVKTAALINPIIAAPNSSYTPVAGMVAGVKRF